MSERFGWTVAELAEMTIEQLMHFGAVACGAARPKCSRDEAIARSRQRAAERSAILEQLTWELERGE